MASGSNCCPLRVLVKEYSSVAAASTTGTGEVVGFKLDCLATGSSDETVMTWYLAVGVMANGDLGSEERTCAALYEGGCSGFKLGFLIVLVIQSGRSFGDSE
jgi:hypothetical protein